jgi:hypothetical protein
LSNPPTASSSIAHLLGLPKRATAAPTAEKPKSHLESLASNAVMAMKLRAKAKAAAKPAVKTAKAAPSKTVKRKAAAASRYAHLQPAFDAEADAGPTPIETTLNPKAHAILACH